MPVATKSPAKEKKAGGASRKDFVRTKISLGENVASVVLLLLMVVIGVAIAIKGRNFNPDLFTVRPGSLAATAAPVTGKTQTAQAAPSPDKVIAAAKTSPAADSADNPEKPQPDVGEGGSGNAGPALPTKPLEIALPGIKPMSDTEFYTADTLYEKIDGRSPAYQAFNVQQLRCRTFSVIAASGSYVDVNEYRFDTPLDAFGMFSSERDPNGKALDFAPDGYSGGMGYFFRQGAVYVQLIASDQKPETMVMATAIAQNRAKELPVDDTGVAARRRLPAAGMIPNSVEFVLGNAQGQSALNNVFQAKYNFDGAQLPFFITVGSPEEMTAAWDGLQKFCAKFGKVEPLPDENGAKMFRAQTFGTWKVIYLRDKELGGVFDSKEGEKGRAFVEQYLQGKIK